MTHVRLFVQNVVTFLLLYTTMILANIRGLAAVAQNKDLTIAEKMRQTTLNSMKAVTDKQRKEILLSIEAVAKEGKWCLRYPEVTEENKKFLKSEGFILEKDKGNCIIIRWWDC